MARPARDFHCGFRAAALLDIGHDQDVHDVVYLEPASAQILMDVASQVGGMVEATSGRRRLVGQRTTRRPDVNTA